MIIRVMQWFWGVSIGIVILLTIRAIHDPGLAVRIDLDLRTMPPSPQSPFGTDWLGRDMASRVVIGFYLSAMIGILASTISLLIAIILGGLAGSLGGITERVILRAVDGWIALPHLVTGVVIASIVGGGWVGIVLAVSTTHFMGITRVMYHAVAETRSAPYVLHSRMRGASWGWIMWHHFTPMLARVGATSLVVLLPHTILHEASLSFLGVGLAPDSPAIGVMLARALPFMLRGDWWLWVFPTWALAILVGGGARLDAVIRKGDQSHAHYS